MTTHYDRENLIDYLHGALDPEADAALFEHLEVCAACRALHDEEAGLGEALRAAARAEELEFPSLIKARVWDAVRRERPAWHARLLTGWGPRLALPLAAAVALVAYLGTPIVRHGAVGTPGVAAAFYLDEHNAEVQNNPLGPGIAPAIYVPDSQDPTAASAAAVYIDTADAATLDDAVGGSR
jgi:predicted anti-sigma-YlaC factor YlaD